MNEENQAKINRPLSYILLILLLTWAIGATITGIWSRNQYNSLRSTIEGAGGDVLVEFIQQHGDNLLSVYDDIGAIRGELATALERAEHAERINERAYELAERSDAEFVEFRNTMAGTGNTITALIANQQRINLIVGRIERNHYAVKMELGMRP